MRRGVLKQFFQGRIFFLALVFCGTISWSITMVKSGLIYSFGMGFWGANGHDGVWHIALSNSLSRGSFEMPVFAGNLIKNYHLGFDLIVAAIHNITKIPVVNLYFQIIPPILAFVIGLTIYLFVRKLTGSGRSALWSTFFVYFGGDLAWVFGRGESTFWSQQSISTLINPPFALSLVFIFLGLYFLLKRKLVLSILFFGILLETKAYAGVLVLGSLFLAGVWEYLKEKNFKIFSVFLGSLAISLVLFFLLNKGSENVFVFSPFWFLQTLFNLDRFSFPRLASAIANYNLAHNSLKLIPAYGFAFVVFWVGNMGTRLFKEIEVVRWIRNFKGIQSLNVFMMAMIIGGVVIPMFFVQKGTPWNTIQFFYYSLIFSAVLAGVGIDNFFEKRSRKFVFMFSLVVILLTIPTTVKTLFEVYIPGRPPAKISNEELSALDFLSKQKDGIVLTYPFDELAAKAAENNPPRPLYLYVSTAYVSAFGNHPVFLEDQMNLDITNFDWRVRRAEVFNAFLNTLDQSRARKFLKENNISYVYWVKPQRAKLGETQLGLVKIFENKEVNLFKVE